MLEGATSFPSLRDNNGALGITPERVHEGQRFIIAGPMKSTPAVEIDAGVADSKASLVSTRFAPGSSSGCVLYDLLTYGPRRV